MLGDDAWAGIGRSDGHGSRAHCEWSEHIRILKRADDYLRRAAVDIKDLAAGFCFICSRRTLHTEYSENTILVGEEVTPAMLADVPEHKLKVVSLKGSGNSHVAILARTRNSYRYGSRSAN